MIDKYSVDDHISIQCDTWKLEDSSILFENEHDSAQRINDSLVTVHNDDIFQDIQRTEKKKEMSNEYDESQIIRISKNINVSDIEIEESTNIEKTLKENRACITCTNGDYPTGLHKYMFCKKICSYYRLFSFNTR
jgi:hypothetical protein